MLIQGKTDIWKTNAIARMCGTREVEHIFEVSKYASLKNVKLPIWCKLA